jgi:antitoxin ParD1/3/4
MTIRWQEFAPGCLLLRYSVMPAKHALNVSLTEHLSDFVASQVASGRFGTSSEVVRAALRLLERDLDAPASFAQRDDAKAGPAASDEKAADLARPKGYL